MGVAGFGVENRRRPFFMGSKCDTLLSSIPICEAVDTFQKGMEQK